MENGRSAVIPDVTIDERIPADRLARSDEIRVAFLRATSHELRTPLTSVVGFAELLQSRDADLDDEHRRSLLGRLTANASRLGRLIDDLLDVDRLTSGLATANREPHDLEQLVRRVVADQELSNHHLELELDPVVSEVDPPKFERVVANLVANATRHTPHGASSVSGCAERRPGPCWWSRTRIGLCGSS